MNIWKILIREKYQYAKSKIDARKVSIHEKYWWSKNIDGRKVLILQKYSYLNCFDTWKVLTLMLLIPEKYNNK